MLNLAAFNLPGEGRTCVSEAFHETLAATPSEVHIFGLSLRALQSETRKSA